MEGLGNEVPFFIYPYDPEDALAVAASKKRVKNRLANKGVEVREINLYDLSVEMLKERGVWDRLLAGEPDHGKDDFRELLQGMLDPELHLAPAIRARLAEGEFDIFLLTGGGFGTNVLPVLTYQFSFGSFNFGKGAANAMILLIILVVFLLVYVGTVMRSAEE